MTQTVHLLGPPRIEVDGIAVPGPRGQKAWALLAYLALAGRPSSRQHLAELLFADADDPLGALRWTLSELRRSLRYGDGLSGDPISLPATDLPFTIDVRSIDTVEPSALSALGSDLLERIDIRGCAAFDAWLNVERYRLSSAIESRLRQVAVGLLAEGRPGDAVRFASLAVVRNVLDEENHELLVRCLASAGDDEGARRQAEACEDMLLREFGTVASPALRAAATSPDPTGRGSISNHTEVNSLLDAGRAAVAAGAIETGLDCLRRAVALAGSSTDRRLHGRSLVVLGGALVHGVRGRDGEGSIVLQEALRVAGDADDTATLTTACRELGFVDVQAGRRTTADTWLARAADLAETDEELAAVLGVRGMNASDAGDYVVAGDDLHRSALLAEGCGDARQQAWSLSILARVHLLRDDTDDAATALDHSLELIDRQRWLAFLPWPLALRAEVELRRGRRIDDEIQRAWALSCQVGDPCWEGMTARMLGLVSAEASDYETATRWLEEAHRRCVATTDRYQWVRAYVLDASVDVALRHGDQASARRLCGDLAVLAARCGMREFVVRAEVHRWRLGESDALRSAELLARDVDNPALHRLFEVGTQE